MFSLIYSILIIRVMKLKCELVSPGALILCAIIADLVALTIIFR